MMRSMYSSMASIAPTSSRVVSRPAQPSGTPAASLACFITSKSARLERIASRPPLRSTALPLLRHRPAICTSASGRDSKITPTTPIGQLTRERISPSASSVRSCSCPMGSSICASARRPAHTSSSLPWSNFSRFSAGAERPSAFAASRSCAFAAKIASLPSCSASATARSAPSRTCAEDAARAKLACLARRAISCVLSFSPLIRRPPGKAPRASPRASCCSPAAARGGRRPPGRR